MTSMMDRRAFIGALGVAALGTPPAANAQPGGKAVRIGFLGSPVPSDVDAGREGMRSLGYVEGKNFVIEVRFDDGRLGRLRDLADDLVRSRVDVIVSSGPDRIRAVQQATTTIPIVMAVVHEPVAFGFAANLAHPGGNITGLAFQDSELTTKRLELLGAVRSPMSRVAVLWNPAGGGTTALPSAQEALIENDGHQAVPSTFKA